tara:strand:+ start:7730 stop:8065 length:336 start_codon:yes stop_codon:yes gene_type:complete
MSKLFKTALPFATTEVSPQLYNRLVRILELNVGSFDPDRTPHFTQTELNTLDFQEGDVIWNTTVGSLQAYLGNRFVQLTEPTLKSAGFELLGSVGTLKIDVKLSGGIKIEL